MEWIGDLERAFASSIYPNRVLIAIVTVIAVIGLVLIARRRGWDGPARRHPGRTIVAAAIVVAIVSPLGWYLASPLVLSTTIDEPAPLAAAQTTPTATAPARPTPTAPASAAPTTPTPTPSPSPPPLALAGTFTGADDFHFGRGTARLVETSPGTYVVRLEDFAVRNGPDLYVYLSPAADGYAEGVVELGRLKADKGNQNYPVPAETVVSQSASVVIWCKQFSVQFAVAPLLASAS